MATQGRRAARRLGLLGISALCAVSVAHTAHARSTEGWALPTMLGRTQPALSLLGVHRAGVAPNAPAMHVDLSRLAPPVGDQGSLPSCASWVVSEEIYSLFANAERSAGPFAPMYLYAQIVRGDVNGTTLQQNLAIVADQGIEPLGDYSYGPAAAVNDATDQPTAQDVAAARAYRLHGASWEYWVHATEAAVESWMSANHLPVVFAIDIYHNFDFAGHIDGAGKAYPLLIQPPTPGMQFRGGHIVIGYRTDADGVWFENSWGTDYGDHGWAELSWSFIAQEAIVYLLHVPSPDSNDPHTDANSRSARRTSG